MYRNRIPVNDPHSLSPLCGILCIRAAHSNHMEMYVHHYPQLRATLEKIQTKTWWLIQKQSCCRKNLLTKIVSNTSNFIAIVRKCFSYSFGGTPTGLDSFLSKLWCALLKSGVICHDMLLPQSQSPKYCTVFITHSIQTLISMCCVLWYVFFKSLLNKFEVRQHSWWATLSCYFW